MTDGISAAYRARRDYDEWDAPHCYVCVRKVEESEMQNHITGHTLKDIVTCLTRWSVDSWKSEKRV